MDDDSWLTVARNRLRILYSNLGIWWYNVILNLDMNELGNGRTQTGIEDFPYNGGGRHLGTGGIGNLGKSVYRFDTLKQRWNTYNHIARTLY